MEMDLRSAITNRDFRLHYQPILRLETGRIVEVEALIRWQHEKRGLLQPDAFIGLTEETGLIVPIGQWVLTEACRQARAWQIEFPRTPALGMSVNLSAKQFQNPKLVEEITDALTMSGLDPACLKLEITESVVMENAEAAALMFKQLRSLGVQLSIDDFGTGYSSLSYLHRFPLNYLKIDRSFVMRLTTDNDNAIVRTISTLARNLGMEVIAEGIETEEQHQQLKMLGCEYGQGYLFSRPVDSQSVIHLLAQDSKRDAQPDINLAQPTDDELSVAYSM